MIRILRLAALLLVIAPAALRAQGRSACLNGAGTQLEITECAAEELGEAEGALDSVHARLVAEEEDSASRVLLRRTHQTWVAWRDAECELHAEASRGGSIYLAEYVLCATERTRRRTGELRRMLSGDETAEAQAAVLQATDALFQAMHDKDAVALDTLLHPRAQVVVASAGRVGVRTAPEWIPTVTRNPEVLRERIWDARVEVDGDLATLWAPYEFYLGDRFSHCGYDAFQFVRANGAWKLISVAFTRRETGCGEGS